MSVEIIGLRDWFDSPAGRSLLAWEQQRLDVLVADMFGYHALQLGLPLMDGLRANRMPNRWRAWDDTDEALNTLQLQPGRADLHAHAEALPFGPASLDLVVLPHTLELSVDPHAALREVQRVLVPEGRVVIFGLNPISLWALRLMASRWSQRWGCGTPFLPQMGEFIGPRRLRDWLRLLSFEVEQTQFGCYRPAVHSDQWFQRWAWMDRWGPRWWPIVGAAYYVVAVKRVHGMRLMEPGWSKLRRARAGALPVAQRGGLPGPESIKRQDLF